MSSSWNEIVSTALIGTEQQKMPDIRGEGAIGALIDRLKQSADRSKESVILCAAGTMHLHKKAGLLPSGMSLHAEEPAEEESWMCAPIAMSKIRLLLQDYKSTLLPLWLKAAADARRRMPELALPLLLEEAAASRELRPLVLPVLGKRGRWLAKQNPSWSYAAAEITAETDSGDLRKVFETGSQEERVIALKRMRDISPASARELLASTWNEEIVQTKASFLRLFEWGLSMEDEAFLEEVALSDKRKEVRIEAAKLLARLPESRYAQRMVARAVPCLKIGGFLKQKLDVSYPPDCDREMVKDGIEKGPESVGAEARYYWLCQMLSLISPAVWEVHFKMSPPQILDSIEIDARQQNVVVTGWAAATVLHRNAQWAEAFCLSKFAGALDIGMLDLLDPPVREKIILKMMEKNGGKLYVKGNNEYRQPVIAALLRANHEWSEDFARKLMPQISEAAQYGTNHSVRLMFANIGFYFPATLAEHIEASIAKAGGDSLKTADPFLSALKFKSDIYAALSNQ